MERPSFDELISAYFDDETSPEESAVVERLLSDPKNRQALDDYRQLRDELRSMPASRLDSEWSARLKERLVTAKPEWATKAVAASASVESPASVSPIHASAEVHASADGHAPIDGPAPTGGPMPASLDRSRPDGYSRFRHLWLTAGVGVAAGTLGIVIGWSSQNLAPGQVAYEFDSAAPVQISASPAPMSAAPPPRSADAVAGQGQELMRSKAESEIAFSDQLVELTQSAEANQDFAAAPVVEPNAMFGSAMSDETADVETAPRMSRTDGIVEAESSPLASDKLDIQDERDLNKAEKQGEFRLDAIPDVPLTTDPSIANGSLEAEGLARDAQVDPGLASYYATYVGVWNSTGDDLTQNQIRGMTRQMNSGVADRESGSADVSAWQAIDDSLQWNEAPALVLEGSPERVAEALEVLSRGRSSGQVRLLERMEDPNVLSYTRRSRKLYEGEPIVGEQLVAAAQSERPAAIEEQAERSVEGALDIKSDGYEKDRSAAGVASQEALALGATKPSSSSAIDRIEAFFDDEAREKKLYAEMSPSDDALAGGFAYGGGGGGSGLSGGGFGGLGGGAIPSAEANGPEPAPMPAFDPRTEEPQADAFDAPAGRPNLASRSTPSAAMPAATPAPVTDNERGQVAGSGPASGGTPLSDPALPEVAAAGVAETMPPPRPAMAGEPVPPAPGSDFTPPPAPASAIAESETPAPPDAAPPANFAAPADPASSSGVEPAVGRSNRFAENPGAGSLPREGARGARGDGEDGVDRIPSDKPARSEPLGVEGEALEMAQENRSLENLHERTQLGEAGDRSGLVRNFAAPRPERVRVILFAAESPLVRVPAIAAPAGPDATPASAVPAAAGVPAESAPTPDR